jgi:flagellar biosynthesis GTPase FlhF
MLIKQFTGATIDEILPLIREELGEDAVILSTRRVTRGGIGGFFGREMLEVTAARPEAREVAAANAEAAARPSGEHGTASREPFSRHLIGRLEAAREAEQGLGGPPPGAGGAPPAAPAAAYARAAAGAGDTAAHPFAPGEDERTRAIVAAARRALRDAQAQAAAASSPGDAGAPAGPRVAPPPWATAPPLSRASVAHALSSDTPVSAPPPGPAAPADPRGGAGATIPAAAAAGAEAPAWVQLPAPAPAPAPAATPAPPRLRPLGATAPAATGAREAALRAARADLLAAGVAERYADPILEGFRRAALPFAAADADLRGLVRDWIAARLPVVRDWKPRPGGRLLVLVGQTGVGKTSVACKLAGRLGAAGLRVAIVGAGPGPHHALEQHARRLGLEAVAAEDAESLLQARGALADRDLVIVDTAGRSHQSVEELEELAGLIGPARPEEVHLVLPVTAALADVGDITRSFRIAGVNRVTVTKLDETRFLGNLVNIPLRSGKALAYVSDGPDVPEALRPADARAIAELLLA